VHDPAAGGIRRVWFGVVEKTATAVDELRFAVTVDVRDERDLLLDVRDSATP